MTMHKNEQWIKWKPHPELCAQYIFDSIIDGKNIFEIKLISPPTTHRLHVSFQSDATSYQLTSKLLYEGKQKIKCPDEWAFFKIVNSDYLKDLYEDSCGISGTRNFIHFSIITTEWIIDIMSPDEPAFLFVK